MFKKFFLKVNSLFKQNPDLVLAAYIALPILLIATMILSAVCPPILLAVGIGSWSLIGNILPFIASVAFTGLMLMTLFSQIGSVITIKRGLSSSKNSASSGYQESRKKDAAAPVENYQPLFVNSAQDTKSTVSMDEHIESIYPALN